MFLSEISDQKGFVLSHICHNTDNVNHQRSSYPVLGSTRWLTNVISNPHEIFKDWHHFVGQETWSIARFQGLVNTTLASEWHRQAQPVLRSPFNITTLTVLKRTGLKNALCTHNFNHFNTSRTYFTYKRRKMEYTSIITFLLKPYKTIIIIKHNVQWKVPQADAKGQWSL